MAFKVTITKDGKIYDEFEGDAVVAAAWNASGIDTSGAGSSALIDSLVLHLSACKLSETLEQEQINTP